MKIVIVGPGALGLLFYSLLRTGGNEVYLVDKDRQRAEFISCNGINFITVSGKVKRIKHVNITTDPEDIPLPELIILTVKSYHTNSALKKIHPLLKENSYILSVQNGLSHVEVMPKYVAPDRILLGITNQGATRVDVNTVRHAGRGDTIIGTYLWDNFFRSHKFLRKLKTSFDKSGINTEIHRDIQSVIWSKLVINVGINALTAITGYKNGRLVENPALREIIHILVEEALAVVNLKKIKLLYPDPQKKVEEVCQQTAENISSMLQDILNNRRTEIDAINGAVIKEGRKLGLNLPYNSCVYKIVKGLEKNIGSRIFRL
ncbi:MAG: 2-dehydropantoate 2-reductase [Candidatus Omnitrophota bacterium]|nr:MAG: 2-dehydropantoate 2-reductase [Candidatus Omnitrophota bacterium]